MKHRQLLAGALALTAAGGVSGENGAENMATVLEVKPAYAEVAAGKPYRQCWKLHLGPATADSPQQVGATRRCFLLQRARLQQEQVGFRVKYLYRGRVGTMLTQRSPGAGDRIRLHHRWRPVFF